MTTFRNILLLCISVFVLAVFLNGCSSGSGVGLGGKDLSLEKAIQTINKVKERGAVTSSTKFLSGVLQEGNKAYVWYRVADDRDPYTAEFHRYNDGKWALFSVSIPYSGSYEKFISVE
jgi:hypothetical protein